MARKLPHNIKATGIPERIARTDAKGKQTQLETRLGRLVNNMSIGMELYRGKDEWFINGSEIGYANPIDALLAAGITDE